MTQPSVPIPPPARASDIAAAARHLRTCRRIQLLGCSGAGKSTLAHQLSSILGLPHVCLDAHYWQPGWIKMDDERWLETVIALAAGEEWIIDGNYSATIKPRMKRADAFLMLDLPRHLCLTRVTWRMLSGYGRVRVHMAPGCPERWDLEFYQWIWNWRRNSRPRTLGRIGENAPGTPLLRLTRPGDVALLLSELTVRTR